MKDYNKLIIVGAPRSGTNMLRDVLCKIDGFGTWPCDEINYIWRHGNIRKATDEFTREMARPEVRRYITDQFDRLATNNNLKFAVEKTCANSLRVPFVHAVFPTAKYIFIYRDGLDVVNSASKRWKAKLDISYLLKKARYVPPSDLPYYALRYFFNRAHRFFSSEKRLAYWGPQFDGISDKIEALSLEEVCALQWQRCVELSSAALENIPAGHFASMSYESFVSEPIAVLQKALSELNIVVSQQELEESTADVSMLNIGKGRSRLSQETITRLRALVGETLNKFGYE